MVIDPHAAATKQDIAILMGEMGKLYEAISKLYAENEEWQEGIKQEIAASEERMKLHFDVVAENMRDDFLGAHKDDIENVKIRVTRLEEHTGLKSAA